MREGKGWRARVRQEWSRGGRLRAGEGREVCCSTQPGTSAAEEELYRQ